MTFMLEALESHRTLEQLIQSAIDKKQGNKEFALFYIDGAWQADIGNPCTAVMLGEIGGEVSADGTSPRLAVLGLLNKLEA